MCSNPVVSQFHCGLFHLHTRPIVSQAHCGLVYLHTRPIVTQYCVPVLLCPSLMVSQFHCVQSLYVQSHYVPVPLCPSAKLGVKASIAKGEWNTRGLLQSGTGAHRDCPLPEITSFQVHHLCVVRPLDTWLFLNRCWWGLRFQEMGKEGTLYLVLCALSAYQNDSHSVWQKYELL